MNGDGSSFDILVFAAIAFFILAKLVSAVPRRRRKSRPRPKYSRAKISAKKTALDETAIRENIYDFPEAKVIKTLDGDTVIVSVKRRDVRIRLDSIDCPEDGQPWGDIAKYGLIKQIGGKRIRLEEHGTDPYGRTLATIFVRTGQDREWMNVNERMVTLGHAWVMRKYYDHLPQGRRDKLNRLERWARTKKVGLWKSGDAIPPWKWRHGDGTQN